MSNLQDSVGFSNNDRWKAICLVGKQFHQKNSSVSRLESTVNQATSVGASCRKFNRQLERLRSERCRGQILQLEVLYSHRARNTVVDSFQIPCKHEEHAYLHFKNSKSSTQCFNKMKQASENRANDKANTYLSTQRKKVTLGQTDSLNNLDFVSLTNEDKKKIIMF